MGCCHGSPTDRRKVMHPPGTVGPLPSNSGISFHHSSHLPPPSMGSDGQQSLPTDTTGVHSGSKMSLKTYSYPPGGVPNAGMQPQPTAAQMPNGSGVPNGNGGVSGMSSPYDHFGRNVTYSQNFQLPHQQSFPHQQPMASQPSQPLPIMAFGSGAFSNPVMVGRSAAEMAYMAAGGDPDIESSITLTSQNEVPPTNLAERMAVDIVDITLGAPQTSAQQSTSLSPDKTTVEQAPKSQSDKPSPIITVDGADNNSDIDERPLAVATPQGHLGTTTMDDIETGDAKDDNDVVRRIRRKSAALTDAPSKMILLGLSSAAPIHSNLSPPDKDNDDDADKVGSMQSATRSRQNTKRRMSAASLTMGNDRQIFARESIRVAYQFWRDNVENTPPDKKLMMGITLYAHMFRKMPDCRRLFLQGDIEDTSQIFLNMMGWLAMKLSDNSAEVWPELVAMGNRHRTLGVTHEHFQPMLEAFHTTFEENFKDSYSLRVKFCFENLFINASRIMTGKDFGTLFSDRVEDFQSLEFLDSLDVCLAHPTGREYLERYLEQTFSPEFANFLRSFDEFKRLGGNQQRWEMALQIYNRHFGAGAPAYIDLPQFKNVNKLVAELGKYEKAMRNRKDYQLSPRLLDKIYDDVRNEIQAQSWERFVAAIHSIKEATRPSSN